MSTYNVKTVEAVSSSEALDSLTRTPCFIALAGSGGTGKTFLAQALTLSGAFQRRSVGGKREIQYPFSLMTQILDGQGTIMYEQVYHALQFLKVALQPSVKIMMLSGANSGPLANSYDRAESLVRTFIDGHGDQIEAAFLEELSVRPNESKPSVALLALLAKVSRNEVIENVVNAVNTVAATPSLNLFVGEDFVCTAMSNTINAERNEALIAICELAAEFSARSNGLSALRNEKTKAEPGLSVSLVNAAAGGYTIRLPEVISRQTSKYWIVTPTAKVNFDPMTLAKALSFFSVCRVGTINSAFGQYIDYASTLKGGLAESVSMVQQELNDLMAETGGLIIGELRDDYVVDEPKAYQIDPVHGAAATIASSAVRLISSSKVGMYLTEKGKAIVRVRAYDDAELEIPHEMLNFTLDDVPMYDVGLKRLMWERLAPGTFVSFYGKLVSLLGGTLRLPRTNRP